MTMTYLFRNPSLSEDCPPITSHGPITVCQRPRTEWWNDEHHTHSLITRNLNGFKNPWKSFHKPTFLEVASGASLRKIGQTVHAIDECDSVEVAEESLKVVQPSWTWNSSTSSVRRIRATWLGHAAVLVQIPPGPNARNKDDINVLIDPIFSERSSPAKSAGPTRIVRTPCTVADLPPIHILLISHNHYDHLDLATITSIYRREKERIHIFVPLGNKALLVSQGIPEDQITQSDWWEEHDFTAVPPDGRNDGEVGRNALDKFVDHGLGRWGVDTDASLWSSWYIRSFRDAAAASQNENEPIFRLFFAGDTGLRFRDQAVKDYEWETCPIFQEIAERLGTPDLALLPISVGGTLPYLKSLDPAIAGYSLVPEIPDALTSSTHMSPGDAVDLHRLFLGERFPTKDEADSSNSPPPLPGGKRMISMAIHFGTFCSGPAESRDTVRTLGRECKLKDVRCMKVSGEGCVIEADQESAFVVVDHGGSVEVAVR